MIITMLFVFTIVVYGVISLLILFYGREYRPKIKLNLEYTPTISIVVPTFNEEIIIEKKIKNLMSIDYPPSLLELIFVDCSNDSTKDIIKKYQNLYPNIRIIEQKERTGLADALNMGYENAHGKIVIKSDCDSFVLERSALRDIASFFADPIIGGVCGIRITTETMRARAKRGIEEPFRNLQIIYQIAESNIDSTIVTHGSFAAFRKELIPKIDSKSAADDTEVFIKIRKQGYKTIIHPKITTYEPAEENLLKRRKQMDRRTQGIIKVLFQNIDMLFNPSYGKYGLICFPMLFFLLVISPILLLLDLLALTYLFFLLFEPLWASILTLIEMSLLISIYILKLIPPVAAFIDIQISALLGGVKLIKGTDYMWERSRPYY